MPNVKYLSFSFCFYKSLNKKKILQERIARLKKNNETIHKLIKRDTGGR